MQNNNPSDPLAIAALMTESHSPLGKILKKATRIHELDQFIQSFLEMPLALHAQVMNIEEPKISMGADSPLWAGKLRLYVPEILQRLRFHNQWQHLTEITIKVKKF